MIKLKRFDDANEIFNSLDEEIIKNEDLLKIKKLLDNKNDNEVFDKKLIDKVNSNPKDMDLRLELANSYLSSNEIEKGFNELLILFEQNPIWNEGAAKKTIGIFDLLGFNDPNVIVARKKLSSMMFK